ncbi:hypothetical protein ACN28E_07940 [Archangium lansingense]|uniref:hypothetical protein n=1 Tax=Archangium lansingense TaxID=2995310 RepID=UPI003B774AA1
MNAPSGPIFFKDASAGLKQLAARDGYATEDELQRLIATHPELLRGDQIDPEDPRRWLLIGREVGIPDRAGQADRWSIDHVFVDHDAIPTFIEVKRSSDARIRREVVGQLIEYAANAKRYWAAGYLEFLCRKRLGQALDAAVQELCDSDVAAQDFWKRADANLRSGNVRLIFVADRIPDELYEMALFLNEQMTHTEVLAIEVRPYAAEGGAEAFVPHVLNATPQAREVKSSSSGRRKRKWTQAEFFEDARQRLTPEGCEALQQLFEFVAKNASGISWGTGVLRGSFNPKYTQMGDRSPISVFSDGNLHMNGFWMDAPYGPQLKAAARELFEIAANDRNPEVVPLSTWMSKQKALQERLAQLLNTES